VSFGARFARAVSRVGMDDKTQLSRVWLIAANDLGIQVTAPFLVHTESGEAVVVAALVHHFGAAAGTLAGTQQGDFKQLSELAEQTGRYASFLYPESYRTYDRQLFIDTLNEWGWYGQEAPPSWYSGAPRTA
jgi:hypothetical protein